MPKKVYIRTLGCQMNEHDSERLKALFIEKGFKIEDTPEGADILLFNTCSVRQHAEERVFGQVASLKALKKDNPDIIFGIIGCMAEAQREKIFERLPHVDFLCGPADLDRIPAIIEDIGKERTHLIVLEGYKTGRIPEFPTGPAGAGEVYVKITEGCDNFCSYCIVPYVRGRERSRPPEDILKEINSIIRQGTRHITLLGQNVNSYGKGLKEDIDFPRLLREIDIALQQGFPDIYPSIKISFVTSHPKDASLGLFSAMADCRVIDRTLHMPLQSGSDRILERMNRGYTLSHYKELVQQYRDVVRGGSILSDFIVGFPGEKEEDFNATLKALQEIQFDAAYIFKYSPRPFTSASRMPDDVPQEEKERRHRILLETQKKISLEKKVKL